MNKLTLVHLRESPDADPSGAEEAAYALLERQFSAEQRAALAKKGHALPDGSYPIVTVGDLKNAIQAIGRASNPAAAKRHIVKRARALGATDQLPADWLKEATETSEAADGQMPKQAMGMAKLKRMLGQSASDADMLKAMTDMGFPADEAKAMLASAQKAHKAAAKETWVGTSRRSVDDFLRLVRDAIHSKYGGDGKQVAIHATFDDHVVFERDGKLYSTPLTLNDDTGEVDLGTNPTEVEVAYVPVQESNAGYVLSEATSSTGGREWDVALIETGLSKNNRYYPPSTLKAALPLFEAKPCFADHATDQERVARPERSLRDKVGMFREAKFGSWQTPDGRLVDGVKATLKVLAPWLRESLLESHAAGETDFVGFSIDGEGLTADKDFGGRKVQWVEKITTINSVDAVTDAAAGGRVLRLVASNRPERAADASDASDAGAGGEPTGQEWNVDPEKLKAMIAEALKAGQTELATQLKEALAAMLGTALTEQAKKTQDLEAKLATLVEAQRVTGNEKRIASALQEAIGLSEIGRARLAKQWNDAASRRDVTDEELRASIAESISYEAALVGQRAPFGTPGPVAGSNAVVLAGRADRVALALDGLLMGTDQKDAKGQTIPAFRSLKEAYCRFSQVDAFDVSPYDIVRAFSCRYDSAVDSKRLAESMTTASWGEIYADRMYKMLIKEYNATPYGIWRSIVSDVESAPDFMTRHWMRVGGYGDLSTVAEQATYPTLTSPTDEEVTYAVAKRGGLDDVTFEQIVNDQVGAIRRIPGAMARAAARTLYKFVFNLITTDNPTMDYDSVALYTSHNNNATNVLSINAVNTGIIAMRDQTAYSESNEILGPRNMPRFIIVPNELTQRARRIFKAGQYQVQSPLDDTSAAGSGGTGIASDAFWDLGVDIITYDVLTSATRWHLVANPAEVPTVVMGFLNGRQDPDLFVQDQPNVGSNFTADKTTFKVRHIYSGDVLDHRSFYQGNT